MLNSTLLGFSCLFTHCICAHKTPLFFFPFSRRPSDWKRGKRVLLTTLHCFPNVYYHCYWAEKGTFTFQNDTFWVFIESDGRAELSEVRLWRTLPAESRNSRYDCTKAAGRRCFSVRWSMWRAYSIAFCFSFWLVTETRCLLAGST